MPSEFQTHRLARSEIRYVEGYGHTQIEMGKKHTALCGYVGYSRNSFVAVNRGVTCLHCLKKMQANKASTRRGGMVAKKDKVAKPPRG